ncbi:tetratricopeptide repeat protein [Treponema pectinovorum]|uniref:hypothetical protein n=1 Tax=Treponema pectinovorum TaxID=164 RepID=UPI0011C8D68C|nr:hypothetical protein [Treponema pectinovorum]
MKYAKKKNARQNKCHLCKPIYRFAFLFFIGIFISAFCFVACSSSPKKTMKITETSQKASVLYQRANSELASFSFQNSYNHLAQAYSLALSVDDEELLTKICLSSIICKIFYEQNPKTKIESALLKKNDEAKDELDFYFYSLSPTDFLQEAEQYSKNTKKKEFYEVVCKVYKTQLNLLLQGEKSNSDEKKSDENSKGQFSELEQNQTSYSSILKTEPYYLAYLKRTLADTYAYKKEFQKAKDSYLAAAEIHIKNRDLKEIGHDFYDAARMASILKQKDEALFLIDKALKYDKDAENSVAIASDYFAFALILIKNAPTEAEKISAKNAALWARKIYLSNHFFEEADFCLKTAQSI